MSAVTLRESAKALTRNSNSAVFKMARYSPTKQPREYDALKNAVLRCAPVFNSFIINKLKNMAHPMHYT
jgi:hypothetical protein